MIRLSTGQNNEQIHRFQKQMNRMVVGQETASHTIADSLSRLVAGIQDSERPLLTMMFTGPTGVGKTETVRCLAETIFGDRRAFTRINCQEFSAHYNISKLLGSPPGYVGGEIRPQLAQENLDKHHVKSIENGSGMISEVDSHLHRMYPVDSEKKMSIILFDEIEKAHPKMWNTLLGILEDGHLVLANNEEVNFTNAIIILTTNVGSNIISEELTQSHIGFSSGIDSEKMDRDIEEAVQREAKKVFPMEFLNRFDNIIPFNTLKHDHLCKILDNQISRVHYRALTSNEPFLIEVSSRAKEELVKQGTDPEYGARPLNRVIETNVVTPVSRYICSEQIRRGDLVMIDFIDNEFVFMKEPGVDWETDPRPHSNISKPQWTKTDLGINDDGGEKEEIAIEASKVLAYSGDFE
ncbi:ATP-dependent Clp protease ATP-binding subunit [bacterium]|nr:ATP-dependent Clp protease ATP-binding subunit [bacterium]MBT4292803.1 ATP-dependent Clp protease ATP-binding subunit [bacterium]MBT7310831.1 ATP-dependent Clp protease ATP-binding subunit [bacterium]